MIVLHQTGKREIYHFEPDQTVPGEVVELTADEAQQIGSILSQTAFEVDPSRELVMKELTIEWLLLPTGHALISQTLRDSAIRQKTGASIVAILRNEQAIINPDPDEVLQSEDTLVVIGNAKQVQLFKDTCQLPAPETI